MTATRKEIDETHRRLLGEFHNERPKLLNDESQRRQFLAKLDELFQSMAALAEQIPGQKDRAGSSDDLRWLNETTTRWQVIYSGQLQIPKNLRKEVGIDKLEVEWTEDACAESTTDKTALSSLLGETAYVIGERRKLAALLRKVKALKESPNLIHQAIPSTSEEEAADWRAAQVTLAQFVIDGRVDLLLQFSASISGELSTVWLDEIKRTRAYLNWELRGAEWDPPGADENYYEACRWWSDRVRAEPVADWSAFQPLQSHLDNRYVKEQGRKAEVHRKSNYLRAEFPRMSLKEADTIAESYVDKFRKLLPAGAENDADAAEALIELVETPPESRIVNGLEAALVSLFIAPPKA